jgi:hypothetical protein
MTLSQLILYPLNHRVVTEAQIAAFELGLVALAEHIERHSPTRQVAAPVKAKRARRAA